MVNGKCDMNGQIRQSKNIFLMVDLMIDFCFYCFIMLSTYGFKDGYNVSNENKLYIGSALFYQFISYTISIKRLHIYPLFTHLFTYFNTEYI